MTFETKILGPGDEALLINGILLTDEPSVNEDHAGAFLADNMMVCVAAQSNGQVVGFTDGYVLRRFEARSLFIYSVDVDPSHQRRGIAKAMVSLLENHGRQGNWDEMFVITNASNRPAMALYAKAGGVRPNSDDVIFDFD